MIEKILRTLFDYQKYENDPGLSSMIDDTHKRYDKKRFGPVSLKDDDLGLVSAAGEPDNNRGSNIFGIQDTGDPVDGNNNNNNNNK